MSKKYSDIEIKKLPHSEVEIVGRISADTLLASKEKALKKLAKSAEFPGFRKGHVPENILVQKVGESTLLEDAANIALEEAYEDIIREAKLDIVGQPKVTITKLAPGNPLEFKIIATVYPEFTLPPYTEIAKEEMAKAEDISVAIYEVDEVIQQIRKHHAHIESHKNKDQHDHNHKPIEEKDLPELTDGLVKQFGNFSSIEDFRKKVKENVLQEKILRTKEKKRIAVIEKIIEKTEIDAPELLIQNELEKMLAQFKDDVTKTGLAYEDYLKTIKKSEDEVKKEWRTVAEKKAKAQLIVGRIAETEKISPDKETLETETKKLLDLYKDANPLQVKMYVATMLLNEKVFQFLESQK